MPEREPPRLSVRILIGDRRLIGPGRADLLENVERTGSISAAARAMRMSYRRAWLHLDELSATLGNPVVETVQGGARGGGAVLSETGRALLHVYRRMQRRAERAADADLARLAALRRRGRAD